MQTQTDASNTRSTTVTSLTPTQWRALTYVQHYQRRHGYAPKLVDVMAGCVLDNRRVTLDVLRELQDYGLVQVYARRNNGRTFWSAKVVGCGVVGMEPEVRG